jgi:hypothetical protein
MPSREVNPSPAYGLGQRADDLGGSGSTVPLPWERDRRPSFGADQEAEGPLLLLGKLTTE